MPAGQPSTARATASAAARLGVAGSGVMVVRADVAPPQAASYQDVQIVLVLADAVQQQEE